MTKIKFVRYAHDGRQMVHHGTCDFCGYAVQEDESNPRIVLDDGNGEFTVHFEMWCWGDRFEAYPNNVLEFALWLEDRGLTDEELSDLRDDNWWRYEKIVEEFNQ